MSRNEGFWISPNSDMLAFEQSDESHIPKYRIMHSGQADPSIQEDHRYPFAGESNPKAKMGVLSIAGSSSDNKKAVTRWLDIESIFDTNDMYLARVQWGPSNSDGDDNSSSSQQQYLYVQVMNREQTEVVLLRFDLSEDDTCNSNSTDDDDDDVLLKGTELLREKSPPRAWVNLHENLIPLKNNKGFIWASERDIGFRHLYYYDENNKCHPITLSSSNDDDNDNEWMVEACASDMIDEANNLIYFTGTKDSPKESHLYCTSILLKNDNENEKEQRIINRITPSGGIHSVLAINIKKQLFIDSWSSINEPHQVALRSLSSGPTNKDIVRLLHDGSKIIADDPKVQALGSSLKPPEWFDVYSETSNDNDSSKLKQKMYGSIYKPDPTIYGDGPYPTIVSVYGGPHAQMVSSVFFFDFCCCPPPSPLIKRIFLARTHTHIYIYIYIYIYIHIYAGYR
jgi:dipeptidyl-peptidase-4